MAIRPIDSEKYMELLKEQYLHHKSIGDSQTARAWQGAMQLLYDMPTLTQPNDLLTPDQLREMEGEPVWVEFEDGSGGLWGIVHITIFAQIVFANGLHCTIGERYYGKSYKAYRRPPE